MSTTPDQSAVTSVLAEIADPETGRPLTAMGQVKSVAASPTAIKATIGLTTHSAILWKQTRGRIEELLRSRFPQVADVAIDVVPHDRPPGKLGQIGLEAKSVIAVGSGKGGVGKSTIATSIAIGLARAGSRVGLLDADVYGPSVPHLLGLSGRPQIEQGKIQPMHLVLGPNQMPVMSMGFLVPPGEAVVWRGPMLHGAISQMLRDTAWGPLDYLIIDMPPGTGDIALSLSQYLPRGEVYVVTTPQPAAQEVARLSAAMAEKVKLPVRGVIENMSWFTGDEGTRYEIFGAGGGELLADDLDVPLLGKLPLVPALREGGDVGRPITAVDPDSEAAQAFQEIARRIAVELRPKKVFSPSLRIN